MVYGCMVYTERAETAAVSCTWHQPCQRCKYTSSVNIEKMRYKKARNSCRITFERNETAPERKIALYKSHQQLLLLSFMTVTIV